MTIRVQGNARGTSVTDTCVVTLGSNPVNGNVLVCTVSYGDDIARTVSSFVQTNVAWSQQYTQFYSLGGTNQRLEIWYGIVSESAGNVLTITFSAATEYGAVANVCEYSGMLIVDYLDKTATTSGVSSNPATGTTAETAQANELWIGLTVAANLGFTQSTPTNEFALLDGANYQYVGHAYLEKIVSATGAATSGTTASAGGSWAGIIATFKGSATIISPYETSKMIGDGLTWIIQ